jgi:FkbM family methyltransferase
MFSRHYFRNWIWAGLKYYLFKRGLIKSGVLSIVCRDSAKFAINLKLYGPLVKTLFEVRELFEGFFIDLRCRDGAVIVKNFSIPIEELSLSCCVADAIKLGWIYDSSRGCWVKNGASFRHMRWVIIEVFDFGEYRHLDVKNKVVVDVGAAYGDSTVYFLLRGAKKVIAVEPCPEEFKELLENLKLNNAVDKVTPINAALASKRSEISVKCFTGKAFTNTITLEDIAEVVDVGEAVLKMDCEGCEYDVILNDYEHVRLFDEVYFEYHAFKTKIPVEMLLKKLSKDFECKIVSDQEFYKRHGFSERFLGLVKCIKR